MAYSPKDVVRIKKEIEASSRELSAIQKQIVDVTREKGLIISELDSQIAYKKAEIVSLGDEINNPLKLKNLELEQKVSLGNQTLIALTREIERLNETVTSLRGYVNSLVIQKNSLISEIDAKTLELDRLIGAINTKNEDIKNTVGNLKYSSASAKEEISKTKEEEAKILAKIAHIRDSLDAKKSEMESLENTLERSRKELGAIRERENNVSVMEQRLSPKYLEVYGRLPNRKNKK